MVKRFPVLLDFGLPRISLHDRDTGRIPHGLTLN